MGRDEPSKPSVAVGNRVDGKQVEDEHRHHDQRVGDRLCLGGEVARDELLRGKRRLVLRDGLEDNLPTAALIGDDRVVVALELAAFPADVLEDPSV